MPVGNGFVISFGFVLAGRAGGAGLGIADVTLDTASLVVAGSIAATGVKALGGSFPWKGSTKHPPHVGSRLSNSGGGEIIGLYPCPRKDTGESCHGWDSVSDFGGHSKSATFRL